VKKRKIISLCDDWFFPRGGVAYGMSKLICIEKGIGGGKGGDISVLGIDSGYKSKH
jgi:hypothetical protein